MTRVPKYARLQSANVIFQAHVRDDSRFVLLAVLPPGAVRGWSVYDAEKGEIISPHIFESLTEAKDWLKEIHE